MSLIFNLFRYRGAYSRHPKLPTLLSGYFLPEGRILETAGCSLQATRHLVIVVTISATAYKGSVCRRK